MTTLCDKYQIGEDTEQTMRHKDYTSGSRPQSNLYTWLELELGSKNLVDDFIHWNKTVRLSLFPLLFGQR